MFGFPGSRPDPRWIIVDRAQPQGWPVPPDQEKALIAQVRTRGYRTVADEDGYLLLRYEATARP